MKRIDFLKKVTAGSSLLLTAPILFTSCTKDDEMPLPQGAQPGPDGWTIDLSAQEFSALNTVGGYGYKYNLIIIRSGESQYMAFSSQCTHQNCTVTYNSASRTLPCPCHGSVFSDTGSVLNGPAAVALKKYTVTQNGNILTIK